MEIYLKEKIGNPDLFTGRRKELNRYLQWIEAIKFENSKSTAILARRKTGKTALLQRLYNLTFHANNGVIPFYYEMSEGKRWAVDFCRDFFLTFFYQYVAFKTRKQQYLYLTPEHKSDFQKAIEVAQNEDLEYLTGFIRGIEAEVKNETVDQLWLLTKETPMMLASHQKEFIVQIIDEFQFLNSEIYWDKYKDKQADDFAAGYLRTAEFKNAPLLVSGSWVGWLIHDLTMMLPGRFTMSELENMPEDEAVEMAFKYSQIKNIPITEETAYLIADISEGNPFYISSFFESQCPDKDLTSIDGLVSTLEFETLNKQGIIKGTWMEYVHSAFKRVNGRHAKMIVLYLCKNRNRQVSRDEIRKNLKLEMDDTELEKKMDVLVKADIIDPGTSNFRYQGVQDNVFDKVFRGVYGEEIEAFDSKNIADEYRSLFKKSEKKYQKLLGKLSQMKGAYAEFLIIRQLRYHAFRDNERFCSMTENLQPDFRFVEYETVWMYQFSPIEKREFQIDVFARAPIGEYSIIGEVKNRTKNKYSEKEAIEFSKKMEELKNKEQIEKSLGFVFSTAGFTKRAIAYFKKHGIAWSSDNRWLAV